MNPSLEQLIAPLPANVFWDEYWAPGRPFLSEASGTLVSKLKAIPGLIDAEALLSRHSGEVDLLGPHSFRSSVPACRAAAFLRAGYNLYFTNVDAAVPEAKELFFNVAGDLGIPPWQVYLEAFAGEAGGVSSRHYDHDINFQILLDGQKEWTLEDNRHIRNPLRAFHPTRNRYGEWEGLREEGYADDRSIPTAFDPDRSQRIRAKEGTVLFLPRGYWHETRSMTKTWAINLVVKGLSLGSAVGAALADMLNQHDARLRAFCARAPSDCTGASAEVEQERLFEDAKRVAMSKLIALSREDVFLSQMSETQYSWNRDAGQRDVIERDGTWMLVVPGALERPVELSKERAAIAHKICRYRHSFAWKHVRYSAPEVCGVLLCKVLADLIGLRVLRKL